MGTPVFVSEQQVLSKIHSVRECKVMLDEDLAGLYGVETRRLNEQVRRNIDRFPSDFMFQLTLDEYRNLISQNATSNWGGRRKPPFAFTEHGVLMLSSVLNSEIAIQVNIQIMRVYSGLRKIAGTNQDLLLVIEKIEHRLLDHSVRLDKSEEALSLIFETLKQIYQVDEDVPRNPVGFRIETKNDANPPG